MTHRDPLEEALFVDRGTFEPEAAKTPFVEMQRVVIRMLFDPEFVTQVYEHTEQALAGLQLSPELIQQLLCNDRRLWHADRLRRSRALKILIDEFKVSTTLALHQTRKLAFLDAFFSSVQFHRAVQWRGYMAIAFVHYLQDAARSGLLASPHFQAALKLEAAMATSRRVLRDVRRGQDHALIKRSPGTPQRFWHTMPGINALLMPAGSMDLIQHIEKYLFAVSQIPPLVLCEDAPQPTPLPELDSQNVLGYLLEPQVHGKVELCEISPTFVPIIQACTTPQSNEMLIEATKPHGISAEDTLEYANQLLEGQVLRQIHVLADGTSHILAS